MDKSYALDGIIVVNVSADGSLELVGMSATMGAQSAVVMDGALQLRLRELARDARVVTGDIRTSLRKVIRS
jgi:hypothetical protein